VVSPSDLLPGTDYDVWARIWNNSTEAPVVGLPVTFSYLSFGMGVQSHFIGNAKVNLGVKGGPNHPALTTTKWTTPSTPGHYCIQVSFTWVDDANPYNNLGQENVQVGTAHSLVVFHFQLRNNVRETRAYRFEFDAYAIPPVPRCGETQPNPQPAGGGLRQQPGTIAAVPPQHDRRNYPLPPGWSIAFHPPDAVLHPGQEITVRADVDPPPGFTGRQTVNVHAFTAKELAGGITLYVER
jgi:hypothetical protein